MRSVLLCLSKKLKGEQMINTYYIGGSPCAGKSTAAEILSEKYNLYYFKDENNNVLILGDADNQKHKIFLYIAVIT